MLHRERHDCWTVSEAGLAGEGQDDNLTVYADVKNAVLVTMDEEFSQRRRKHSIGRHIWLRCRRKTPLTCSALSSERCSRI